MTSFALRNLSGKNILGNLAVGAFKIGAIAIAYFGTSAAYSRAAERRADMTGCSLLHSPSDIKYAIDLFRECQQNNLAFCERFRNDPNNPFLVDVHLPPAARGEKKETKSPLPQRLEEANYVSKSS